MTNKRWQISRRTVLRGVGAALGLPLLEAMRPLTAHAQEGPKQPVRMACLYMPNGINPHHWTPKATGKDFDLPELLAPLANVKSEILVLTELMNKAANTGDGHYVKTGGWLTGTTITKTVGSDLRSGGVSMDQVAAQKIGNLTPLPSLELGIEPVTSGVDINVGYTRLYGSHISWSTPTTPVAKEINPQLAFDRLFRPKTSTEKKDATSEKSVLDLVMGDAKNLRGKVGHADQLKLDEYLDSVRAIEKRIAFEATRQAAQYNDDPLARAEIEKLGKRIKDYYIDPGKLRERGVDHTEHVRLMLDIMVLAFWTDSTRISTFMFGNAVSGKNFSFIPGVNSGHHQISHHENDKAKLEEYKKIGVWHLQQYAYMLEKMKQIKEGDGTLLDNSMILFGAGMRDGNAHDPHNLPLVLAGRGGKTIKTGRHLVYPKKTPFANLFRSMLTRVGAPVSSFADSTGELPGLDDENFGPPKKT
ncbi:MAG TPA: DUF1552 domain-containing protein [Planctomycetota bacterium]|nr:DUF1552 domain-containing protein [Planctomycetota bacterium]